MSALNLYFVLEFLAMTDDNKWPLEIPFSLELAGAPGKVQNFVCKPCSSIGLNQMFVVTSVPDDVFVFSFELSEDPEVNTTNVSDKAFTFSIEHNGQFTEEEINNAIQSVVKTIKEIKQRVEVKAKLFLATAKDAIKEAFVISHVTNGVTHYTPKPEFADLIKDLFMDKENSALYFPPANVSNESDLIDKLKAAGLLFTSSNTYQPDEREPSPFGAYKDNSLHPWVAFHTRGKTLTWPVLEEFNNARKLLCEYLEKDRNIYIGFDEVFFESHEGNYPTLRWVLITTLLNPFTSLEQTHKHGVDILAQRNPS